MSLFGTRIAESTPSEGGAYWMEGQYLVSLDVVKLIESRKGGHFFIVEGDNLDSTNEKCPKGSRRSWVVNMAQDAAPGNIKSFCAAALGIPVEEVTEEVAESIITSDNPLNGVIIRLETVTKETKAGGQFTKHNWKAMPKAYQDKAAELRDEAGLPPF